jgi:hypothetical protein
MPIWYFSRYVFSLSCKNGEREIIQTHHSISIATLRFLIRISDVNLKLIIENGFSCSNSPHVSYPESIC